MGGVKFIQDKRRGLNVAVFSIMLRPQKNQRYEVMRKEVNKRLQEKLRTREAAAMKMKEQIPFSTWIAS